MAVKLLPGGKIIPWKKIHYVIVKALHDSKVVTWQKIFLHGSKIILW